MNLLCPGCDRRDRLEFEAEDTFISLGAKIGPDTYEMKPETDVSAFEAARLGWRALEAANKTIERLATECERLSERLQECDESRYGRITEVPHGPFVASQYRSHFHRPECVWAQPFLNKRYCQIFESHEEAVEAGKKPCKTCRA